MTTFSIWRDIDGSWRWKCSHCYPPCYGRRHGPGAWQRIVATSMPGHFARRSCHHAWAARVKPWLRAAA